VSSEHKQNESDHIINDIAGLVNQNERLKKRIAEQLVELACLHQENTLIYRKIGDIEESTSITEKHLDDVLEINSKLENKNRELKKNDEMIKAEVSDLQVEIATINMELQQHIQGEEELKEKIKQIENSKSWIITKPLRTLLYSFKRNI